MLKPLAEGLLTLEEEDAFFFGCVAPGMFPLPQGMGPHLYTSWELSFHSAASRKQGGQVPRWKGNMAGEVQEEFEEGWGVWDG